MSKCVFRDEIQTGLVVFRDFGTSDYPRVQTGEEDFLFLPGCLVVFGESGKDIQVEVRVGNVDIVGARKVFEGVMNFSSGALSISDPESPSVESLYLPRVGNWSVQVYVRNVSEMEEMYFAFDSEQWENL